jgi:hypothetical protein
VLYSTLQIKLVSTLQTSYWVEHIIYTAYVWGPIVKEGSEHAPGERTCCLAEFKGLVAERVPGGTAIIMCYF